MKRKLKSLIATTKTGNKFINFHQLDPPFDPNGGKNRPKNEQIESPMVYWTTIINPPFPSRKSGEISLLKIGFTAKFRPPDVTPVINLPKYSNGSEPKTCKKTPKML